MQYHYKLRSLPELKHVISDFSEEICFMNGLLMENYKRFAAVGELAVLRSICMTISVAPKKAQLCDFGGLTSTLNQQFT